MFERFTERARLVVVYAQEEARTMKHDYIGTEHLLLGLLREEDGLAARALDVLGVGLGPARAQIVQIVGAGQGGTSGQIPFTPRAKAALEHALREALAFGDDHIGTEHVLLALVHDPKGVASRVLRELGAEADRVRAAIAEARGGVARPAHPPTRAARPWFRRMRRDAERRARAEGRDPDGGDLLLAVTRDADGVAGRALAALGVERSRLRDAIADARRSSGDE